MVAFQRMSPPQIQAFTLTPHSAKEGWTINSIGGKVCRARDGLLVSYVLEGDLERLSLPERRMPRFADELWRHTCFELFVACKGEPQYHEFNFSPSGEWAAYFFARYRERVQPDESVELTAIAPRLIVRRSAGKLELDAIVRLDHLAPRYRDARLMLGLSAVVEARDNPQGSLSYWALKHPLAQPDFHHPDAFVLEFDEIRN